MPERSLANPTPNVIWTRSDAYHNSFLIPHDPVLEAVLKNSKDQGVPDIALSHAQAKFLNLILKTLGAKKYLEVGTLGGYSAIWAARALPQDGQVLTLEIDPHHAKVAQENFKLAGLENKIQLILGPAAESLAKIQIQPEEPFDLAFIDADKANNLLYFTEAKRLVRPGGVIIVDNVVWNGNVADPEFSDATVEGIRQLLHALKEDKEVEATTVGTAGEKGYDGFIYAIRK
ncbi:O-methyltransferase family 3 protein [Gymnopilus junonius]|uniref:O-methyltransferase family 3 protein n=1 Tax=Gymnopilus junonius TaxID=109634 RepID=A0A9P5NJI3_GYMJU|nr:O-methyltransferase family 3 protein [Gymnopilus junonius]